MSDFEKVVQQADEKSVLKLISEGRLTAARSLREFAWALKRLADRYERCATQPSDDNERKARVWELRARNRMASFKALRRAYLGGNS